MPCCDKTNCKKIIKYEIFDLFNCKTINFYALPQFFYENYKKIIFLKGFIDQEKLKNGYEFLALKWCLFLNQLFAFFPNKYLTFNLEKLQKLIYSKLYQIWNDNFLKLFYYILSLDYSNFKDSTDSIEIFSTNEEPTRTPIENAFDFKKDHIKNQNATANLRNSSNFNKIIDEINNRQNILSNFFYLILVNIKNNLQININNYQGVCF